MRGLREPALIEEKYHLTSMQRVFRGLSNLDRISASLPFAREEAIICPEYGEGPIRCTYGLNSCAQGRASNMMDSRATRRILMNSNRPG